MKTILTIEQSAELIRRGVSENRAHEIKVYNNPVSEWTHRGCPLFTLADLIPLLPKTLDNDYYSLDLSYGFGDWTASYIHWDSGYELTYIRHTYGQKTEIELIDALYELLLWGLDNNYVKLD